MSEVKSRLTPELRKAFPEDFMWGASVSTHQVEGDNYNQWARWELETAKESAQTAKERLSRLPVWEEIEAQASDPDNYISAHADRHYNHYEVDFMLARSLGLNTFRFNIEWSRIEPEEGAFNLDAIKHYKKYIKDCIDLGLTPIVGLWHWTNPIWFEDKGAFTKSGNLKYWRRFVEKVADELDWSKVRYVDSLNEANVYAGASYLTGEFPPGKKNKPLTLLVYMNLYKAHRIAYSVLSRRHQHLLIGVVHHISNFEPKERDSRAQRMASKFANWSFNWFFLNRCKYLDFIGVNYYRTEYLTGFSMKSKNPEVPVNDLGWYMKPDGIEKVLVETWRRFKKPLIVTENGVADMHDQYRLWWITETIHGISAAMRKGVEVRGYCHWSLLDNFEWQHGWFPKFGLVSVDRNNQNRTVKKSAKTWSSWLLHG